MNIFTKIIAIGSFAIAASAAIMGISTEEAAAVDSSCVPGYTLRAVRLSGGTASSSTHASPCRLTKCRLVGKVVSKYGTPTPFNPMPLYWSYQAVEGVRPSNYCGGDVNGTSAWDM